MVELNPPFVKQKSHANGRDFLELFVTPHLPNPSVFRQTKPGSEKG